MISIAHRHAFVHRDEKCYPRHTVEDIAEDPLLIQLFREPTQAPSTCTHAQLARKVRVLTVVAKEERQKTTETMNNAMSTE